MLDNWSDRKDSAQKIVRKAIGKIVTVPGTMAFPLTPNSVRVGNYKAIVVTMTGLIIMVCTNGKFCDEKLRKSKA